MRTLPPWLRALVFLGCLAPLVRMVGLGLADGLGANPVEWVTRSTGTWALVMLCLTLAATPLRRLTGWPWPIGLRRMLGLFAFFYGLLHLTTWVWFDQWFEWPAMLRDVIKRPFITAGMTALVLMIPLAMTSTRAMMRRLGVNWKRLHRLVYVVAGAAILHHFWMRAGKHDFASPLSYAAVLAGLMLLRLPLPAWARRLR